MNSKPSKSARKREFLALQSLGEQLIGLTPEQLQHIGLEEALLDAVSAARSMRAHGALRRQKQLIGKLMREVDPEPIRAALETFGEHDRAEKAAFKQAEEWRDRLCGEGQEVLTAYFDYLGHPSESVAAEIRAFRLARSDRAQREARRRIFRHIHEQIIHKMQRQASNI